MTSLFRRESLSVTEYGLLNGRMDCKPSWRRDKGGTTEQRTDFRFGLTVSHHRQGLVTNKRCLHKSTDLWIEQKGKLHV